MHCADPAGSIKPKPPGDWGVTVRQLRRLEPARQIERSAQE